jgi:nucleolar protein 15
LIWTGAADAAPKPKKQKKVDEAALATKKSAKALNAAVKPIDDVQVNVKVSRKRAADLFDDGASAQDKAAKEKKVKKSKTVTDADGSKTKATVIVEDVTEPKAKKSKKEKNAGVLTEAQKEEKLAKIPDEKKEQKKADHSKRLKARKEQTAIENAEEDEEDDQTAALLAGFESDNDEDDPAEDAEELDIEADITADIDPKTRDALEKAEKASKNTNEPGVIYVGCVSQQL